jgi:glycosyltransferase involved in cell wall biosynthesis
VARQAGRLLLIAGIVQDQRYFDEQVAPHVDGVHVRYLGPVGAADRVAVLGGAHALLHLIGFDEPFGFSVAEAMACGTPVIAYDRGSMRELIDDGSTGFVVGGIDAAVAALHHVDGLDRAHVRAVAVQRFSADRMVGAYVDVYRQVLADRAPSRPGR